MKRLDLYMSSIMFPERAKDEEVLCLYIPFRLCKFSSLLPSATVALRCPVGLSQFINEVEFLRTIVDRPSPLTVGPPN